jgi:hypothetical protein
MKWAFTGMDITDPWNAHMRRKKTFITPPGMSNAPRGDPYDPHAAPPLTEGAGYYPVGELVATALEAGVQPITIVELTKEVVACRMDWDEWAVRLEVQVTELTPGRILKARAIAAASNVKRAWERSQ